MRVAMPSNKFQALLLFGAMAGLAVAQAPAQGATRASKTWQILSFPGVQNALGPAG